MSIKEQSLIYQNNISQPLFSQNKKYIYYIQKKFNTTAIFSYNIYTKHHQPLVVNPPPASTLGYGGACYTSYLDKIFYTAKDKKLYSLCLKSSKLDTLSKDMSALAHPIISKNGRAIIFIGEKDEIQKYIKVNNLKYFMDPTNSDIKYKRNNIRINIFPTINNRDELFKRLLKSYKLKTNRYNRFSINFRINKNKFIKYNKKTNTIKIHKSYLLYNSIYSFKLIVQGLIEEKYKKRIIKREKYWKNLYKQIALPNNIHFAIHDNIQLYATHSYIYIYSKTANFYSQKLVDNNNWVNGRFSSKKIKLITEIDKNNYSIFLCPYHIYKECLYIRKWFYGDRFKMQNGKTKLISDLFNDHKVLPFIRSRMPIVLQNNKVEWIPGLSISKNNYLNQNNLIKLQWNKYE